MCAVSAVGCVVFQVCALHGRLRLTIKDRETLQEELALAKDLVIQVKVRSCAGEGEVMCR